jgi:BirA family transcriptional regulator, biotin operon repressor / biotin---[acetyl-CoA-carboxylase] ligase
MWLDLPAVESALDSRFVGRRLVYLTSTSSTMDVARAEAEADAPEGTAVFAEEQTAGRGRFGRAWLSPTGKNLYLTVILRPSVERLRRLTMMTPLAVCLAIEEATGIPAQVKWPNDVLLAGRKACGVLIDIELAGDAPRYALVGIGVNVNYDIDPESEIADIATSVKEQLGRETAREPVLASLLNHLEKLYEQEDGEAVRAAWKARLETLGRRVQLTFAGEVREGLAEDVDGEGNLILLRDDSSRQTFEAGEVSLRPPVGKLRSS